MVNAVIPQISCKLIMNYVCVNNYSTYCGINMSLIIAQNSFRWIFGGIYIPTYNKSKIDDRERIVNKIYLTLDWISSKYTPLRYHIQYGGDFNAHLGEYSGDLKHPMSNYQAL